MSEFNIGDKIQMPDGDVYHVIGKEEFVHRSQSCTVIYTVHNDDEWYFCDAITRPPGVKSVRMYESELLTLINGEVDDESAEV